MKIEICLTGFSHDGITWPQCQINIDGQVVHDCVVKEKQNILLDVSIENFSSHTIKLVQYGKMFGENRIWHTKSLNGEILSDRYIILNDIKFDDVSIKQIWHNGFLENEFNQKQVLDFTNSNLVIPFKEEISLGYDHIRISYNGGFVLNFETPIYDWIILKKLPFMKMQGKMKESSLTSIASWRLDYTEGNALEGLYNECMALLDEVK